MKKLVSLLPLKLKAMEKHDLVKFEVGRNTCPFVWSESWTILTYCEHYPTKKVGSEGFCQKQCNHYVGLIDNGNDKLYVKCAYKYSLSFKIRKIWKTLFKN